MTKFTKLFFILVQIYIIHICIPYIICESHIIRKREGRKGRGRTLGNEILGNFNFLLCKVKKKLNKQ